MRSKNWRTRVEGYPNEMGLQRLVRETHLDLAEFTKEGTFDA